VTMDWLPGATRKPMHEDGFAWQANCPHEDRQLALRHCSGRSMCFQR
jgi:hypothetical protein